MTPRPGDGEKLLARARRDDWEGIIAKRVDSTYQPGARSRDWLKLKVEFRQEFVVGGYTEPRNTREHLGALLLGYFDGDDLVYVGHTGGGFTRDEPRGDGEATQATRAKVIAVLDAGAHEREGTLGAARGRGRSEVQRMDGGRPASPADLPRRPRRQGPTRGDA